METPQFKKGSLLTYNNEKMSVNELRQVSAISLANLFISKMLLLIGIVLILLNNFNVIEPGSYFGALNFVTIIVFSIGVFINFFSIPFLYFSSFRNFKAENDFWDRETFWILPLFFFGTFFVYASQIDVALTFFIVSLLVITIIHLKFFHVSWRLITSNLQQTLSDYYQYNLSLKYLTAYYMLLLLLLVTYNPLQEMFIWIRLHV